MIVALVANILLLPYGLVYQLIFVLHGFTYLLAILAFFIKPIQSQTTFKIPLFFVMVNFSILVAWYKFLRGEKYVVWKATER